MHRQIPTGQAVDGTDQSDIISAAVRLCLIKSPMWAPRMLPLTMLCEQLTRCTGLGWHSIVHFWGKGGYLTCTSAIATYHAHCTVLVLRSAHTPYSQTWRGSCTTVCQSRCYTWSAAVAEAFLKSQGAGGCSAQHKQPASCCLGHTYLTTCSLYVCTQRYNDELSIHFATDRMFC